MKTVIKHRWNRGRHGVPFAVHLLELAVGVLVVTGGQGMLSALVGASPDITPPSVPASLQVTGRSASTIDLSWAASSDDVAVTGYHVYRNGSLVAAPVGTAYTDTGLVPNTSYSYTVSAYDAIPNESSQSAPPAATSTLADSLPPSVPANLHQTGQTTSSVTIAWNASSDNVGVTSYDIYRNGLLVRTQAGTSYNDPSLAVYSGYNYNVTARDAANNTSNLSSTLIASTSPDTTPPGVPDNLHKAGSTVSTITLAWDVSTDDVGVSGYHVYRNGSLIGSPGGTSYTDTGLTVSSSYTYTVSAYDAAANTSNQSAPFLTTSSNDTTPPTIPASPHTTAVFDTSASLAWSASTDDVAVTGYKIYRDGTLIGTSAAASYNDTGLSPVTDYTYNIESYDAASNTSVYSADLAVRTAFDTTPPTVPAGLAMTARTDTSISLSWTAATDNVAVSGYDLYRDSVLLTSTVGTSFTDSGLAVDTSYSYQVRAHDGSSNHSAQSAALAVRTLPDTVLPAAPSGLSSLSQTTTTIDVTWNMATDDVAVASYNVYRDGGLVASVTGTDYTDSGLHYNQQYRYTVRTVDASNNQSPASPALDIATLPDTTPPAVALNAPSNGQALQLTFPISAAASDDLSLNRVEFYVDGSLIASISSAPFALNWNSYAVHNGSRTITAKAFDSSGNSSTQSVSVAINNPPPPLTADVNGDHRVNILDLSLLLSRFNKPGAADFNNNGKVDIFDLSVLLARFGQDNSGYH